MQEEDLSLTNRDKIILRELSTNSRVSLTQLARMAKCSVVTVAKLVDRLARKLDIRFTLEVNMDRLEFSEKYIIAVKFRRMPDEEFIRNLFKNDIYAQDVYLTKGDFSLLIFAAANTPSSYLKWETDLATNLSDYLPELRPSEFLFPHLGYMPLNNSFVNFMKEGIKVDEKDKRILRLLNTNSRMSYRDMSKKLGINEDTIRYRVFKLVHKGVISRFTVAVQNANRVLVAYLMRYRFSRYTVSDAFPQMRSHYMKEDEDVPLMNSSPFIVILSGSYRLFGMSLGKTKEESLSAGVRWHLNLLKNDNPHEVHAIVIRPVKGLLPLRNLDAKRYYRFLWT